MRQSCAQAKDAAGACGACGALACSSSRTASLSCSAAGLVDAGGSLRARRGDRQVWSRGEERAEDRPAPSLCAALAWPGPSRRCCLRPVGQRRRPAASRTPPGSSDPAPAAAAAPRSARPSEFKALDSPGARPSRRDRGITRSSAFQGAIGERAAALGDGGTGAGLLASCRCRCRAPAPAGVLGLAAVPSGHS